MHNKVMPYFKIFFFSKYDYKLPNQREVLLYDSSSSFKKIISYYIKPADIDDLHVRGEVLNLPVFFISLFSFNFFN